VIEDDFILRTSLARLLTSHGYIVECAADGLEALQRLNNGQFTPSVIVLDLVMPYMDGLEFRELQCSLPALAGVPVVVITGDARSAAQAVQLEVDSLHYKPLNTSRLLENIRELASPAVR
jgi:CheY-like chemotaxis protein